MRDPARIPAIVAALEKAWLASPELRLAQLVAMAAGSTDPFYVEDETIATNLGALAAASLSPVLGGDRQGGADG